MRLKPFELYGHQPEEASLEDPVTQPVGVLCCKVVKTPNGPRPVIFDKWAYQAAGWKSFAARFVLGHDGCYHCRRCNRLSSRVQVVHYRAKLGNLRSDLLSVSEADKIDLVCDIVAFCDGCEEMPDLIGFPIVPYGSYYNQPN